MNFKLRISIVAGLLVFLSFQAFYLIEYFYFFSSMSFVADENFHIGRFFISVSFSFLTGLLVYVYANNFYDSLRDLSHKIQVWGNTLEKPIESVSLLKKDPDIESLEKFLIRAIEENDKKVSEKLKRELEKNNTLIVESFKPYLPENKLKGIEFLDASIFPSSSHNFDYDLVQIIETEKGFILLLTGFEKSEIFESIYKLRIKSICSTLENLFYFKEDEILKSLEKILEQNYFPNLRLSIHYVPNISSHLSSLHFQKMPMMILDDSGISLVRSDEIYLPTNTNLKFHRSVFEQKSYLILISDHITEKLNISPKELILILEKEVFARPIFSNSKELIYQISILIEKLGKEKEQESVLEWLFAIVLFKK